VNTDDLLKLLRQRVKEEGGQSRFAQNHGLSQGYVANVLCGTCKPGPSIAVAVGMKLVRSFEPIK
jgi:hypothetical protein